MYEFGKHGLVCAASLQQLCVHVAHNKLEHQDMRIHASACEMHENNAAGFEKRSDTFLTLVGLQKYCCLLTLQMLPLP